MKTCSKCKTIKPLTEFVRDQRKKLGVTSSCKMCRAEATRARRAADTKAAREYDYQWRQKHKERLREYLRTWQKKTRPQRTASHKKWLASKPDYYKLWYSKHREKLRAKHQAWLELNREVARELTRRWRAANKDHRAAYARTRRRDNHHEHMLSILRSRMSDALRRRSTAKAGRTIELLGCTIPDLIKHLEARFLPGMNWGNYGLWHIDHIRPCATFDLTDVEQQRLCFNYANLQPLWAEDNVRKWKHYKT